jgi:antitoxin MazE
MITKVQRWGNSQGVRLNKQLLAEAEIEVGDEVDIAVSDGTLVVKPARRVRGGYDLRALVRDIGDGYEPGELDWGRPAGREVW